MYEDFEFPFDGLREDAEVARELESVLIGAVRRCVSTEKKCALFYSGGLDSTVVAKILHDLGTGLTAYVAGIAGSPDVMAAKKAAAEIGFDVKTILLKQEEVQELVKAAAWITKGSDPITIGVSVPLYAAAREAAKDDYRMIFSGAGSDELFAGYDSHARALEKGWQAVHNECIQRIHHGINRDIARDISICSHFGLESKAPFLDMDVVRLAMSTHPRLKISTGQNKLLLRQIANAIGIPKEISERKKKAAQYGSGVSKVLRKISRQQGFRDSGAYLSAKSV
jgi:asparagine synthase (glutamine-hydrolysing)